MQSRFETFTVLIAKINRSIRKLENREVEEFGLRSIHGACLYYLYSDGELTATELCDRCEEDKATISRALELLESEGFISCPHPGIKRYKRPLVLTKKGCEIGRQIFDRVNSMLDKVSTALTEEERVSFYSNLSKISTALDKCVNTNE